MDEVETPPESSGGQGRNSPRSSHRAIVILAMGLVCGAIFVLDIFLPLGAIAGMPYVILVMLGWLVEGSSVAITTGAVTTLLTIVGHPLSPADGNPSIDLVNRMTALAAIWCSVLLLPRVKRREDTTAHVLAGMFTHTRGPGGTEPGSDGRAAITDHLAGTAAHELRNPLGVIATSISVIEFKARETGLDITAALERAKRAITRCETIIDEYLDAARAKRHRPQHVRLDDWLTSLVEEMPQKEEVALVADLRAPGHVVSLDPEAFRRVLINLIDNAHQALADKPDGGTVTIGSRVVADGAEILVEDNGPGIPADLLSRVTETLFSTKPHGTGLGLPTAQRIVDDHGGTMTIESGPERGTRVVLRLPSRGPG